MIKYKKKLGQNFLIDNNVKNKIVDILSIKKDDVILEIGSGAGYLSEYLSLHAKKIFLIEIDINFYNILKEKFAKFNNVIILNEDFLRLDFKHIFKKYNKIRVVGNIPYNISKQIIFKLSKFSKFIKDVHLTVQRDFAYKFRFDKSNVISYLFFIIHYKFDIDFIFDIHAKSFFPKPKVASSFIRLEPHNKNFILNFIFFKKTINELFKKKRKIIINIIPPFKKFSKYFNAGARPKDLLFKSYIRILNLAYITKTN